MMSTLEPRLVSLSEIRDPVRGTLGVAECGDHVPFEIKRVFYIYDCLPDIERGGHAHKELEQFLICLAGSFRVDLEFSGRIDSFLLDTRDRGLYVPPMSWLVITPMIADSICLVLASDHYSEADYIREKRTFDDLVR